jgi:hypothetical protein
VKLCKPAALVTDTTRGSSGFLRLQCTLPHSPEARATFKV